MNSFIENFQELEQILEGDRTSPSFHDGEINSITFDRSDNVKISVNLEIFIKHLGEYYRDEVKFSRWKKAKVSFLFKEVQSDYLNNFNHQNVINDLHISLDENSTLFDVWFESIFGCDLKFKCKEIGISGVEVFEFEDKVFEPDQEILQKMKALKNKNRKN